MMKNQKTVMRKTIYHNQRHPCRVAMLFMRRNVPASIPDVSENASFYIRRLERSDYTTNHCAHTI